jgi:acetyl esterase/lipase
MKASRWRMMSVLGLVLAALATEARAQDIRAIDDVVYGHMDGMAMVYDVAIPEGNSNGAGVVFVISGGFLSSREQQEIISPIAEPLVEAGFTVFYLRHPSTPRYMAPEIYDALRMGMDHILANAVRFDVDPSRMGVMGMSTGGLLALLLGLDVDDAESRDRAAAVVAYMPVVDMRAVVGNVQATPSLGFPTELAPSLSPVDFVSPDDPPVLMIHGSNDVVVPLQENSERMLLLLEQNGITSELVVVEAGHELFSGAAKEQADTAVVTWFESHLVATP